LLILVVLNIIPLVNFVVLGYLYQVIKIPSTSSELPPLKEYLTLWVLGLKILVALFIYLLVPLILIAPFFLLTIFSGTTFSRLLNVGGILSIFMLVVGLLLMFFICIIMMIALVHSVKQDSFSKVFAVGEIVDVIGAIGWGTYILWLIVTFTCTMIVGTIGSIPWVGWIISLIIAPIFGVFVARSASLIYSKGTSKNYSLSTISQKKFCLFCGEEITQDVFYCPICSKKQET
jgi:hypothetical protein